MAPLNEFLFYGNFIKMNDYDESIHDFLPQIFLKRLIRSKSQDLEKIPPQNTPIKKNERTRRSPTSNRLLVNISNTKKDNIKSSLKEKRPE